MKHKLAIILTFFAIIALSGCCPDPNWQFSCNVTSQYTVNNPEVVEGAQHIAYSPGMFVKVHYVNYSLPHQEIIFFAEKNITEIEHRVIVNDSTQVIRIYPNGSIHRWGYLVNISGFENEWNCE